MSRHYQRKLILLLSLSLLVTGALASGAPTITVLPADNTLEVGETTTVAVLLETAPTGLSGFNISIALTNPSIGEFTWITFPAWAMMPKNGSLPADTVYAQAVDLERSIEPGATNVTLCTLTFRGDAAGTTNLTITPIKVDDDIGGRYTPGTTDAMLVVESPQTPVVADFTAHITTGTAPLAVSFTDTSTGNPTSWFWDFGDNTTSTEQHPTHTYTVPGTYTVSLTATNSAGSDTAIKQEYITITGMPDGRQDIFLENFSGTQLGDQWIVVPFTDRGSYSLTENPGYLRYYPGGYLTASGRWRENYTATPDGWSPATTLVRSFESDRWALETAVNYHIHSRVPAGSTGAQCVDFWLAFGEENQQYIRIWRNTDAWYEGNTVGIHVDNAGGSPEAVADMNVIAPDEIETDGWFHHAYWYRVERNAQDVDVFYSYDGLDYTLATSFTLAPEIGASQRIYLEGGEWAPAGTHADWDYIDVISITTPERISASFTANITAGTAPLAVRFTDTSTGNPTAWLWDFGDGKTSTEQHPTHTYTATGMYYVNLTVSNNDGSDTFHQTDPIAVLQYGDVNFDGNVNLMDILLILHHVVGLQKIIGPLALMQGDLHRNDLFDVGDAQIIAYYYIALDTLTPRVSGIDPGSVELVVVPDTRTIPAGEQTTIDVMLAGAENVSSYDIMVRWDSTVLDLVSQDITVHQGAGVWNVTAGEAHLAGILLSPANGNLTLCTLNFAAIGSPGSSSLISIPDRGCILKAYSCNSVPFTVSTAMVTIGESAPIASFTTHITAGTAPLAVRFTDTSTGNPTAWLWDFGDGKTSTEQHPTHTYTATGTYNVTLNASNAHGYSISAPTTITVRAPTPTTGLLFIPGIATISPGDTTPYAMVINGVPAGLSGFNISIALTEPSVGEIVGVSYPAWAMMPKNGSLPADSVFVQAVDLEQLVGVGAINVTLCTLTIRGDAAGTTNLAITPIKVDDDLAGRYTPGTTDAMLVVENPQTPVVANFTANATIGLAPLAVRFTDTSTGNPTVWLWDFGDNTTSTEQHPIHTYTVPGTYTVSLTATNSAGSNTTTRIGYITVSSASEYSILWNVPLSITSGTYSQTMILGSAEAATRGLDVGLDIPIPPDSLGAEKSVYFTCADPSYPAFTQLAIDYKPPIDDANPEESWILAIRSDEPVQVAWNTTLLSGRDLFLTWDDGASTIAMKAANGTTLPAGSYTIAIIAGTARQMDLPLQAGWNLISTPFNNATYTVPDGSIIAIYGYNSSTKGYDLISRIESLVPGKAYWIASSRNCTVTMTGAPASPVTAELKPGWNLIGNTAGQNPFGSIAITPEGSWAMSFVYGYNPQTMGYIQITELQPGEGYWGAVTQNCTITLS